MAKIIENKLKRGFDSFCRQSSQNQHCKTAGKCGECCKQQGISGQYSTSGTELWCEAVNCRIQEPGDGDPDEKRGGGCQNRAQELPDGRNEVCKQIIHFIVSFRFYYDTGTGKYS